MRYRITVRGHGIELRGYLDAYDPNTLARFGTMMEPFGMIIASPAEADYDPFREKSESTREQIRRVRRDPGPPDEPTSETLQEWADEAERGYDPIDIKQVPHHEGPGLQQPGGSLGGF